MSGPGRCSANLFQQKINKDPDFCGKYIGFRIDQPQGRLVVDPVVGQDTNQRAIGDFAVNTPHCIYRNTCSGDGCNLLAQAVIDGEPAVAQTWMELSGFAVVTKQRERGLFLECD